MGNEAMNQTHNGHSGGFSLGAARYLPAQLGRRPCPRLYILWGHLGIAWAPCEQRGCRQGRGLPQGCSGHRKALAMPPGGCGGEVPGFGG